MWSVCRPSFWYSLGAAVYIVLVAEFMSHANAWFGKNDNVVTAIVALLLFSLSALIVGGLLVGKPVMLYIDGKKKDAIWFLVANAGWMLLFFIIAIIILLATK